jgi:TRAP-type C4-dicarboxylate transport system substrate-binding protein
MHRTLKWIGAAVALAVAAPSGAQNVSLLTGWGPNNPTAYMPAERFKANVEAASGGKAQFRISGPEAVPPFEQMQPLTAGAFDLLYTHPAYHSKGFATAAEILAVSPGQLRSSGVWAAIDRYYQKNYNMKLLSLVPLGTEGYHCYFTKPLGPQGDWSGRKIRGVATQFGVIKALGGVSVTLPMGDVYTAMEKGVVDGACAPASVFLGTKHYEVAKYRVEPRFGQLVSLIGMNLDRWGKLSKDEQAAFEKGGAQTELDTLRLGDEILKRDNEKLAGMGVQAVQLPKANGERIRAEFTSSNWEFLQKCCGDAANEVRELARKAGMAK